MINGFVNVVISTLERRFDLPSTKSGLIASTYDIATSSIVVFVSYYGERRHKVCIVPDDVGHGVIVTTQFHDPAAN